MNETEKPYESERSQPPGQGSGGYSDETRSVPETEVWQPPVGDLGGSTTGEPSKIGRYRIIHRLGQGGFGRVYLAHDDDLDRPVAIKLPNPERMTRPEDVEAFLDEARILAKLDHPNIVPVHDVGRTEDGLCFVVSKLFEGSDLAVRIGQARLSFRESAELVATIADALHYAHTRGLVHRDIKPANILIDASGKPCVADFGLALRDEDFGKGGGLAGTPSYMSPEQAKGEGHLVDGRSDIFSLGVVFYELLTGRRPFRGDSLPQIIEQVTQAEARPPRQIDDTIPKELERICLKALAKRASERYTTARDMAEDLRFFLQTVAGTTSPVIAPGMVIPLTGSTQESTSQPTTPRASDSDQTHIKVIPKGLRSFDQHDADFFLELLPGPRDRDGLPDSIRFWKDRIEETDPDQTFRVGLIYGPSGCGKSSLVKAGLLPRLAKHVLTVYIEATPDETETRILRALQKACPDLATGAGLIDSLAAVRKGRILHSEQKILLVLDQFEQWLHARRGEENTELVNALRQCDGEHLQAVVLVRDDFWLAASRFMRDLEIRLVEGENSALVDLFDPRHAKKVLTAFGTAYGNLPERRDDFSREQRTFLDQAITDLAQDGKVISVRLALFAEMVKGKPWTPATLRAVGGTEGVGVTFLEETFSATSAPPEHRVHQKAAQAVLKSLLPETGTDIKGQMRSVGQLQQAAVYADRPRDFAELIHILDGELRLITPTDPEGSGDQQPSASSDRRYYQLTHDFLVPSLRDWLTRKERETRRGRAELRLAERSSLWNSKPENRHLPSALEWANIRLLTRKKDWTDPQRRMMRKAEGSYRFRLGLILFIGLTTRIGIEVYRYIHTPALVEALKAAKSEDISSLINELAFYRPWANPRLFRLLTDTPPSSSEHLHASLALLPVDTGQVDYLYSRMFDANPDELLVIIKALRPHKARLVPKLWSILDPIEPGTKSLVPPPPSLPPEPPPSPHQVPAKVAPESLSGSGSVGLVFDASAYASSNIRQQISLTLRTAIALADYDPENQRWEKTAIKISNELVTLNPLYLAYWVDALRPVKSKLKAALARVSADMQRPLIERMLADVIQGDYSDSGALASAFPMLGD